MKYFLRLKTRVHYAYLFQMFQLSMTVENQITMQHFVKITRTGGCRSDQLKFNFWMLANKYRKSHLNSLLWILTPGVHHFLLVNLCLAECNDFGFRPRFQCSPPISSLVHAAHYFQPVASAAQLCHFPSGYKGSLTQENQRIDWKSLQ